MEISDYISIGSAALAIGAFLFSAITSSKKFELTSSYRNKILDWYEKSNSILVELEHIYVINDSDDHSRKMQLLADLSSNIEVGRFYFPNINLDDKSTLNKPLAYRGRRHIVTNCLAMSYEIYLHEKENEYEQDLKILRRTFTSQVFESLNPSRFMKMARKHTITHSEKPPTIESIIGKTAEELIKELKGITNT